LGQLELYERASSYNGKSGKKRQIYAIAANLRASHGKNGRESGKTDARLEKTEALPDIQGYYQTIRLSQYWLAHQGHRPDRRNLWI